MPEPFRFCLRCGVTYSGAQRSDFGKLAGLGSGGRSTATTILAESVIRWLRQSDLAPEARKLLSFTDNRQDASLQAGHLNDFIQIGPLRSALFRAVSDAGHAGLRYDVLAQRVFNALDLDKALYAVDETVKYAAEEETKPRSSECDRLPALPRPRTGLARDLAEPRAVRSDAPVSTPSNRVRPGGPINMSDKVRSRYTQEHPADD